MTDDSPDTMFRKWFKKHAGYKKFRDIVENVYYDESREAFLAGVYAEKEKKIVQDSEVNIGL